MKLTPSQKKALDWIRSHGGDAAFDKNGVAFTQGEHASVYRSTWNALRDFGLLEFYGGKRDGGSGYGRLRLTPAGIGEEKPVLGKVRQDRFTGQRSRAPMLDEEEEK